MLRIALASVLALGAIVALGAATTHDSARTRKAPASERRAVKLVKRDLAKHRLADDRVVRCRRSRKRSRRGTIRFACSWRAARRLSPNRTRRCRGRTPAAVARRRGKLGRTRGTRCRLDIKALQPHFGFHDNSVAGKRASADDAARLAEGAGAGIYRLLIDWRATEPAPGVWDFSLPDRVYKAMLARGVRPLFLLSWAPYWAWGPGVQCTGELCHFPPARQFDDHWREFAAKMASRYPKAAGIEIWNEPNESSGWNKVADAERYAELLEQAYKAIKAVNPSMKVISGGLSNRADSGEGSLSLTDFTRTLFLQGAGRYMDGIAIHPYVPRDRMDLLDDNLNAIRSIRSPAVPIWVTEVGATTTGPADSPLFGSEADQAEADVNVYKHLMSQSDVQAVLIHTLIDPFDDAALPNAGFGVIRGDGSRRPAYCALARATGASRSCR